MALNVKTMDVKKKQNASTAAEPQVNTTKIFDFVGAVKSEFKKISWTNREELLTYTKIVVAGTFLLGLGIYLIDLFIQGALNGLGVIFQMIAEYSVF